MTASTQILSLEEFLKLPSIGDSPAWEYVDGVAVQKPMPETRHSILQKRLLNTIDNHTDTYTALPESRCTFGGRSIVLDIAAIAWNRIQINERGNQRMTLPPHQTGPLKFFHRIGKSIV
ncbi:MAG: Uma2 family endonuclease [Leptolyngbya sp. IPPAS B-1204]